MAEYEPPKLVEEPAVDRQALNLALADALELADEGWSYAMDYFIEKWKFHERYKALETALKQSHEAQVALSFPEEHVQRVTWAYGEYLGLREVILEAVGWPENASRPSEEELREIVRLLAAGKDPLALLEAQDG